MDTEGWASLQGGNGRMFVSPTKVVRREPTRCIFCAESLAGRRSREHVFARWVLEHYGLKEAPFEVTLSSDVTNETRAERHMTMDSHVAGRVCRDCNGGWMSDLEGDVGGLLISLAHQGRPLPTLDAAERKLLALWGTKTAFAARRAPTPVRA
jgi:hypothetical protein